MKNHIKIKGNIKLSGIINIPSSKSYTHRAIISASLTAGKSILRNINSSIDIEATISAMIELGSIIVKKDKSYEIDGSGLFKNDYENSKNNKLIKKIDCKESGSTLRFLIPISLIRENSVEFIGEGNLAKRPLTPYFDIFKKQNIKFSSSSDEHLNLQISGQLKSSTFKIRGDISSQFISGLLFSLPLLDGDSSIIIEGKLESKSYIDMTLDVLKQFSIDVDNKNYEEFNIKGKQKYKIRDYKVEGDYSQAAFFLVANSLGSTIEVKGLNKSSIQGDKVAEDIIKQLENKKENESLIIDGSQCPDIIPVIALRAALTKGNTEIINISRLRIKECDRLKAIVSELNKLGAKLSENKDSISIIGVESLKGGVLVDSWSDHRIAMTLAIASSVCEEDITIKDFNCVKKSYPNFWNDFKNLGGETLVC